MKRRLSILIIILIIIPFTQIGASKTSINLVLVGYLIVLILLAIASLVVYRSMWYNPFNQKDNNEL